MKRLMLFVSILGFAISAGAVTFNTNTSIATGNTLYDGQDIVVDACALTVDGQHAFKSLRVTNGGIVTHSPSSIPGLSLTIAEDVLVDITSTIDVSGKGYDSDTGPGKGGTGVQYGGGGGYGGLGGNSDNDNAIGGISYGSITEPVNLGSGGGSGGSNKGGAGGGAIRLTIAGTLTIEGHIAANGADAPTIAGGGGSGGSIYLLVDRLSGAGAIVVNGGVGGHKPTIDYGGGGSGGRIAIYYSQNSFIGNLLASGKLGAYNGGAGTIFRKRTSETCGHLLVDNDNVDGALTPLTLPDTFADISAANYGKLDLSIPGILTVIDQLIVADRGFVYLQTTQILPRVHILPGGELGHRQSRTGFDLIVTGDVIIESGGAISGAGKGYGSDTGPGKGGTGTQYGGGGGHGGMGGSSRNDNAFGGSPYGLATDPIYLGSGGGSGGSSEGGAGGGAIRMTVNGILDNKGRISANGADAPTITGGGGSGGSLYLVVGTLTGTGAIVANGGVGGKKPTIDYGGGGSGGRIAIYSSSDGFVGPISVDGGLGFTPGEKGTIYQVYIPVCGDVLHPYPVGDLNRDCRVNLLDVAILAEHWLECSAPGC
jgi:hypothetical protein